MIGRVGLRSETFSIGWSNADGPTVRGRPGGNRLPVSLGHSSKYENLLDSALNLLYVHEMFDALTPASLATPPRKGIGARIFRGLGRVGAALQGVVAGRLRRRPSGPDSPAAPDAEGSTGAKPARAPRQPRRSPIAAADRHRDLAFTAAMFPNLTPARARIFQYAARRLRSRHGGPRAGGAGRGDCRHDDAAGRHAGRAGRVSRTEQPAGRTDRRDAWHAAGDRAGGSGRGGGSGHAGRAGRDRSAGSLARLAWLDAGAGSAVPPDGSADAQGEAAPATAGSDQPAAPPVAPPPSGPALIGAGTNTTQAPHDRSTGPRQFRRRSCRGGRRCHAGRFAARRWAARRLALPQRTIPLRSQNILACVKLPPRLLCYAACAGPPVLAGAPNPARRVTRHARDHRMVVPRYLIPVAGQQASQWLTLGPSRLPRHGRP